MMTNTLPEKCQAVTAFPAPTPSSTKPLIMVVGADADTRFMLRVILEVWNYDVMEAETLDASIAAAASRQPALILLDGTLCFIDALEDVGRIKRNSDLKNTPSVLLSGFSQPNYEDAAISSGASGFMVKPVDFDLLHDHIRTLVDGNLH